MSVIPLQHRTVLFAVLFGLGGLLGPS